jgi:NADP-dependent 3-hydroxy acid dehydrogenase YdfG
MRRDSAVLVRRSHARLALVVARGSGTYGAAKMRVGGFRQSLATTVEMRRLAVECSPSRCGDAQRTTTRRRPGTRWDESRSERLTPPYSGGTATGRLLALGRSRQHRVR